MKIRYHAERLERILKGLSTLTGMAISFLDTEGNGVCHGNNQSDYCEAIHCVRAEERLCRQSDRELLEKCRRTLCFESHICHAGLYDAAMPIVKNDRIVGYVLMGRVRLSDEIPDRVPQDEYLRKLYQEVPVLSTDHIESLRSLLPNILFESAIEYDAQELIDQATDYIKAHLAEDVSLRQLCTALHVSKNRLYEAFHAHHHCTVNEYVSAMRLEQACRALARQQETVYQIAERVGLDNYTYFCKWFKKQTGLTPGEYRRRHAGNA